MRRSTAFVSAITSSDLSSDLCARYEFYAEYL